MKVLPLFPGGGAQPSSYVDCMPSTTKVSVDIISVNYRHAPSAIIAHLPYMGRS